MTRKDNEIQKQIRNRIISGNHSGISSEKKQIREADKKIKDFNNSLYIGIIIIAILLLVINIVW